MLGDGHVVRVLELTRMDAQVPVGGLHERLELVERERRVGGECAHDAQSHAVMEQRIELPARTAPRYRVQLACRLRRALRPASPGSTRISHRSAVQ